MIYISCSITTLSFDYGFSDPNHINQFSDSRVIVRGSADEKNYYAEVKRKKEEHRVAVERKEAELRENLKKLSKLIIGTWRDENSMFTYRKDGTCLIKYDNGESETTKWKIDGDMIIDKFNSGQVNKYKILALSKNKITLQWLKNKEIYHATRVE